MLNVEVLPTRGLLATQHEFSSNTIISSIDAISPYYAEITHTVSQPVSMEAFHHTKLTFHNRELTLSQSL